MTEPRLSHVMIFVKDVPKMAAFYERAFAFTPEPTSNQGFVELKARNGAGIALHALPEVFANVAVQTPAAWRDEACQKVCIEVADLDTHRQRILTAGGQAKDPWHWERSRFCECADPEGNVLQIFEKSP